MTKAEILRRTLECEKTEARRRENLARANGLKLTRYCSKRGYAVPPEMLSEYRYFCNSKRLPAREAARILGLLQ